MKDAPTKYLINRYLFAYDQGWNRARDCNLRDFAASERRENFVSGSNIVVYTAVFQNEALVTIFEHLMMSKSLPVR